MMFAKPSQSDNIRFIVSNHQLYHNANTLLAVLANMHIDAKTINLDQEAWWQTNNWWDDKEFMLTLAEVGVPIPTTVRVKLAPFGSRVVSPVKSHE